MRVHKIQTNTKEWIVFDERWPHVLEYVWELDKDTVLEEVDTVEKRVAMALHAIQQGVSKQLVIHGRQVGALTADQTNGYYIGPDDILSYLDPWNVRQFSRLSSMLTGDFAG